MIQYRSMEGHGRNQAALLHLTLDCDMGNEGNTPLPPGMVIGPDGKPCKACTGSVAFKSFVKHQSATAAPSKADSNTSARFSDSQRQVDTSSATVDASSSSASFSFAPTLSPECPPDSLALGRATWTFLHTTAAYYPEAPNPQQRRQMLSLLTALPTLYPCSYCAQHLGGEIKKNPPDVSGRTGLSRWLCGVHNEVNERLGKEPFNCAKVLGRWKDGPSDGSCD